MRDRSPNPAGHGSIGKKGLRAVSLGLLAVACIIAGILIASNIDLPSKSVAQSSPGGMSQTSVYPVVERDGHYESPFVSVVERVQNAVVNISARIRGRDLPWYYYGGGSSISSGSGFFFRKDGYILTNSHVVSDADELVVRTASGYEYQAKLVGADPLTDLAVIKVEPEEDITTIDFGDSETIKVGDWAIAIGNPFPQQGLDRSVTVGVISAIGRSNLRFGGETPAYQNYIQTDASINPGNSGGPLLNLQGECIGVNAAISTPNGASVGIGFAIPINMARAIVPDLIENGVVSRGWLGVWLSNLTARQAKAEGLDAVKGVMIDSVFAQSPADKAGIKRGDVVVGFNERDVQNSNQFSVLVSTVKSGMTVPIDVIRDGKEKRVYATVTNRESFLASASNRRSEPGVSPERFVGMDLENFTQQMADNLGIKHVDGVYVTRVYPGSPADRASITAGTIIMQVNNEPVKTVEDIHAIAQQLDGTSTRIPLIVQEPDGQFARKVVRP